MEERVRAALRLRPEAADEDRSLRVDAACDGADAGGGARSVVVPARDGRGHVTHALDCVFGEGASQASVFAWCAPAVADVALRGVHATIFAYGQTGTGKTHTMLGEGPADGPQAGVIPRAAKALFEALKGKKSVVHASYLQIYGDKVSDMLAGGSAALQVREAPDGAAQRVFVQGLSEYRVASAADVLALVARGGRARATRATDRNASSSRSHAVLQLSLEVEDASTADRTVLRRAKLSLVDLAGSEKWTDAAAKDDALAGELRAINASLAALGNCIAALADHAGKPRRDGRAHVPYRDSVLTRLLQDALGGGTRAVVIATASASRRAEAETSSTLAFAQRATRV
ncbi:P-loop containing nucleoside triphosphate hydrolase protein, partial [Pelagophyceae sp. CCMP2097]